MTQSIMHTVIEDIKAAIMAVSKAESPSKSGRPVQMMLRKNGPALQQLTFDWKAQDKHNELNIFKIKVRNTFITNSYNIEENKEGNNTYELARPWWTQIFKMLTENDAREMLDKLRDILSTK